jgi:hypothetical protein
LRRPSQLTKGGRLRQSNRSVWSGFRPDVSEGAWLHLLCVAGIDPLRATLPRRSLRPVQWVKIVKAITAAGTSKRAVPNARSQISRLVWGSMLPNAPTRGSFPKSKGVSKFGVNRARPPHSTRSRCRRGCCELLERDQHLRIVPAGHCLPHHGNGPARLAVLPTPKLAVLSVQKLRYLHKTIDRRPIPDGPGRRVEDGGLH